MSAGSAASKCFYRLPNKVVFPIMQLFRFSLGPWCGTFLAERYGGAWRPSRRTETKTQRHRAGQETDGPPFKFPLKTLWLGVFFGPHSNRFLIGCKHTVGAAKVNCQPYVLRGDSTNKLKLSEGPWRGSWYRHCLKGQSHIGDVSITMLMPPFGNFGWCSHSCRCRPPDILLAPSAHI